MGKIGKLALLEQRLLRNRALVANTGSTKGEAMDVITFRAVERGISSNELISVVDDLENGTLKLMIENPSQLGIPRYNALVDFCTRFMGREPSCVYKISHDPGKTEGVANAGKPEGAIAKSPVTVITWCDPEFEDLHLRVVVNGNGLIGDGYDELRLSGDRKLSEYYDRELRERICGIISVRKQLTA